MTTPSPIAVREYLARVRTALADLPAAELDEVLDDVRPHLTEIADELGEGARLAAMVERLGTPESYAAELRAAGDYPPPSVPEAAQPKPREATFLLRLAVWSIPLTALVGLAFGYKTVQERWSGPLVALLLFAVPVLGWAVWYVTRRGMDTLGALPEMRWLARSLDASAPGTRGKILSYFRSLAPAWWLACAVMLMLVAAVLLRYGLDEAGVLVLLVLVAAAGLILWAGPQSKIERRWLWAAIPLSAFVLGAGLGLFNLAVDQARFAGHGYAGYEEAYVPPQELTYDGKPVRNIYVFDENGKALSEVFLYDHNGQPIEVERLECDADGGSYSPTGRDNQFPHPQVAVDGRDVHGDDYADEGFYQGDGQGHCTEREGVPFTVAIPNSSEPKEETGPAGPETSKPSSPSKTPTAPSTTPTPTR